MPDKNPTQEYKNLVNELRETVTVVGEDMNKKFGEMDAEQKLRLEKINERMDDLEFDLQKAAKSKRPEASKFEHFDTFKGAFENWAKGNRHGLHNSVEMKAGYHPFTEKKSDNLVRFDIEAAGALLLPNEMSMEMLRNVQETSPIMQLATVSQTSAPQRTRTLRKSTPGINWIGEEEENPKGKVKYRIVTLTPQKAAARYGFTIEQFQDSAWDIMSELTQAYSEDFDIGVGTAAVKGNGNKKPKGFINEVKEFESAGQALLPNMLVHMQESIKDAYQRNGSWLMTRKTRGYVRSLVLGDDALHYLWEPDFTRKTPTLLLGAPVYIAAEGDLAGELTGDFTVGDKPIVYGDFRRGYEITMHTDMYLIDDPYTESSSFVRNINIMSRVDGQPLEADEALVALKITEAPSSE